MATSIGGCRHWVIEFDQDGTLGADGGLIAAVDDDPPADLFVFSPGWNASPGSARQLGDAMLALIAEALAPARRAGTGLVTVLWPLLLFPEDEPAADGPVIGEAGAVPDPAGWPPRIRPPGPPSGPDLAAALAPAFPDQEAELSRIGVLLDSRPPDPDRLAELHRLVSGLVTTPNHAPEDDGESTARTARTRSVLAGMAALGAGVDGGVQELGTVGTTSGGGRELLRVLSYYEMKNRAGMVGRAGLGPLLGRLQQRRPGLRVHLVGHSFGARLVSFALDGLPPGPVTPVRSLLLVQAAFSHFSFAPTPPFGPARPGALAAVADRVDGPLIATFSGADRALGWWYPNASRLARQDGEGIAAFGFRWGALGHDGFQQDGVLDRPLQAVGSHYDWQPRTFYRLDANQVINRDLSWLAGAHSDIRKPEIAWAAATAAGLQPRAEPVRDRRSRDPGPTITGPTGSRQVTSAPRYRSDVSGPRLDGWLGEPSDGTS